PDVSRSTLISGELTVHFCRYFCRCRSDTAQSKTTNRVQAFTHRTTGHPNAGFAPGDRAARTLALETHSRDACGAIDSERLGGGGMGKAVGSKTSRRQDQKAYRRKVRGCLDVFALMLDHFRFDEDRLMTGFEVEIALVDSQGDPPMRNAEILRVVDDPI